jgi:Methane/Phenol/Toluene Hydroxylase
MTQAKASPRSRTRGLKTWSSFGDLGRRPTEYEVVTHNLNHTTGTVPLEMGPEVHGNVWLRTHRDAMKLAVPDWDAFRDPDSVTYATYCAGQDDQETYVEGLLEEFDGRGYDATLGGEALGLLRRVLTPGRYFAHAEQMLSAYVQQLAPSSYVSNCAVFQTADQLRRVQLTAYRTRQLQLTYPDRDFATGERDTWQSDADWQPLRRAAELALVEFDWDRALVVTNLVVKPVGDLILLRQFSRQAELTGAGLDALIADNLWLDSQRSQRWTAALIKFLAHADSGNTGVLQALLAEFAPLGQAMTDAGARLLAPSAPGRQAEIAASVRAEWAALLEGAGLAAPSG